MMQTSAQRARSHSARAGAYTRRAKRFAERAASFYQTSHGWSKQARTLTQTPGMWSKDYTPAALEESARTWASIADTFLRMSFGETTSATHYREMAALARQLAS